MSESILPFATPVSIEKKEIKLAKEWAWDFEKEDFALKNGRMYKVTQDDAIKIWIWKLFKTERFENIIYSWKYGTEIKSLIGEGFSSGFVKSEAERFIKESIDENLSDYVKNVRDVKIEFKGTALTICFKADTIYSEEVDYKYEY